MSGRASASVRTLVTGGAGFLGTNLTDVLRSSGRDVRIIGRHAPARAEHLSCFTRLDVRDREGLDHLLTSFRPSEVVHLAAKTDFVTWDDPVGMEINREGTRNILEASARARTVERVFIASSHVVLREDARNRRLQDYAASKRATEEVVRSFPDPPFCWTILRPCSLWGPWFQAPFREFFLAIARGRYVHPGSIDPPKRLGFVGNTCFQIERILSAPAERIDRQTITLADPEVITLRSWASLIAREFKRPAPNALPEWLVQGAALLGDGLHAIGVRRPPLTSFRLANMRTDTSGLAVDQIMSIAGPVPFSVQQGVRQTIAWLEQEGLLR